MRHYDRNEITVWASEKSSIMKKCKAAVSTHPSLRFPRQPRPGGSGVAEGALSKVSRGRAGGGRVSV